MYVLYVVYLFIVFFFFVFIYLHVSVLPIDYPDSFLEADLGYWSAERTYELTIYCRCATAFHWLHETAVSDI